MSKRSMDFAVLLQAYSQNPAPVIEEIIRSTYRFTLSLALLILQDFEDALVTTETVYQQAFRNLEAFPTGTNFEGWIAAIAVKLGKKNRRKRTWQAIFGKQFWGRLTRSSLKDRPAAGAPDNRRDGKILAAVYELPEGLRLPAFFHFSQRFSQSEIAQILHTSEEKINRRVASAVEALTLSGRPQDLASIEMVLANPLRGLVDSEPLLPDLEGEIEALIQDLSSPDGLVRSGKKWLKHGKEAGWTLMVISLVLTVGWVLSRRPSDARLEPRVLLSATPPPVPLEQERTYIFLEGDEAGDDIQVAAEPEGSWESVISADGRWVAFSSSVKNLVPGDKNGMVDIFVFDLERETIERVNISNSGMEANRNSYQPAISADGRFVVYTSAATNLDPRDHQLCGEGAAFYNCFDIFLRDRRTNETRMISVTSDGEPVNNISVGPAISADGRWVAYWSMADNLVSNDAEVCGEGEQVYNCADIFLHDLSVGTTERIGIGRTVGETEVPFTPLQFSADGGTLLTTIRSPDLIAPSLGMENNQDIYLFNREAGSWAQVNVSSDEEVGNAPSQAASISGDGRYVAFASAATNLIPSDERGHIDVFLRNLENRYTERISEVRTGEETDGDSGALEVGVHQDWYFEALEISQDARWLLFVSKASNLSRDVVFDCSGNPSLPGESYLFCYHLYLHDRLTRVTRHIYGPFFNYPPYASISADGSRVIFLAETNDCHSRGLCTDIFIYDRLDRSLRALSVATADASPFIPSTAENLQWAFVNIFRGHRGWINDLRFTHDGSQLVSAALDNSVRMWTVPRGESALVLRNLENSIFVATSSLDGNSLVTGAMDGDVLIWQLPGGRLKGVIEGRAGAVAAVEYSPDGKNLAIGTPRGVTLYNTDTVDKVEELKYPRGTVTSVAFSTDGRFLAVGNSDHSVWVHRVEDGEVVLRLGSHTRDVTSVAFSPDGKYLASGSADRTVNVWALSGENGGSLSAALYKTFSHFDWVSAVVFSPDGKTLISGSYDGAVRIWTLLEGAVGNELLFRRPQDQIRSLSITWDGAYLAAGTSRGEIYLWRALAEE